MEVYQLLEQRWAEFNELDPAGMVTCSSGTSALHLALEALRLPAGGTVLTSDFNMVAVPRAISMAGLEPAFVDCDERLLMDPELTGQQILNADAVIVTHIYGRQFDFGEATRHGGVGLWDGATIIEDLAEAHGIKPRGDMACWSFYHNKIVAGQEGGAVWFRDPEQAALARQLRSLGFTPAHDFRHVPRGHNYRMSNAHAELVLASLKEYRHNLEWRRLGEWWYDERCLKAWKMPIREVPWVYDLRLPWGTDVARVVRALNAEGIAARCSFKPMSGQEEFAKCRQTKRAGDQISEVLRAALTVIYLPLTPGTVTWESCRRAFEIIEREEN